MTTTSVSNTRAAKDARTFPASFAQQRLWFLDQLQGESTSASTLIHTVRIGVPVNEEALGRSLNALVGRHEVLRTTFLVRDEQPLQVVAPALTLPLPVVDLCALPPQEREAEALRLASAQALRPFDLARGPLLRATLFRLGESDSLLLLLFHHIIFDGWSVGVFFRELLTCYQAFSSGLEPTLAPLPIQYADFAAWQRDWLAGQRLAEPLAYWQQHLAGAPAVLELPTDHPRPAIPSSRGACRLFSLPSQLGQALKALSLQEGVSLYMTLVAAFWALLSRYTGSGGPAAGHPLGRSRPARDRAAARLLRQHAGAASRSLGRPLLPPAARPGARGGALGPGASGRALRVPGQGTASRPRPGAEPVLPGHALPRAALTRSATRMVRDSRGSQDGYCQVRSLPRTRRSTGWPPGLASSTAATCSRRPPSPAWRGTGRPCSRPSWPTPMRQLSELPLLSESERHQLLVEWNATATRIPG